MACAINLILQHRAEGMAKFKNLCIQPMYMYACMFVRVIVRVCVCHVLVQNFRQGQTPYIALRLLLN